jgi:predicted ATP-dependent endonuclease of OLD family
LLKKKLNNKLNPRLRRLSKNLTMSVKNFLPDIKKIELASPEIMSRFLHDSCDIIVDDGTKTSIELKGDGIKNLIAISIIHHTTQITSLNKNIILAIEEPESHLHPEAIHKLRKVLEEISEKNQVIVTTHSPLLINRANIKKNLLVNQSRATAAKNIAEIREILGVKISDNLACASLIILVEGEEDIKIIKTWLSYLSTTIKNAFKEGKIEFDSLKGSSNLDYKISLWKNLLCDVFVFLDGDKAGENAFIKAQNKRKITEKEICFVKIRGFKESEIEDLIEINCYKEKIREVYGVSLEGNIFRNNRKKWSDRVKDTFIEKGKPWFEGKEAEIKKLVSQEVEKCGLNSLKKSSLPCIQTSIDYIEDFLNRN